MGNWADRIRRGSAGAALVAIVIGGIGIGTFILFGSAGEQPAAPPPTQLPTPTPVVPAANEFTVGVVVSRQDCAPAGECRYTYTIEPRYIGLRPLPERELLVRYRIDGGHTPQDGDFAVRAGEARYLKDVVVTGPPGARLSATVVDVTQAPVHGPTVAVRP